MNIALVLLVSGFTLDVALCTTVSPLHYYEQVFSQVVEAAQTELLRGISMQLLRDVAEGHAEKITNDTASRLGIGPKTLQLLNGPGSKHPDVRARAYYAIARTGLPEALEYLQSLSPAQVGDLGPRDSHEAWPAAQIALQEARLMRLKATQEQATFLENALAASFDSYSTGKIHLWASQKLCDMGISNSLPQIEKFLRSGWPSTAADETNFCRERMWVVQKDPNRVRALGSVLNVGTSPANLRLTQWAIEQLGAINSKEAAAELDRFFTEIGGLHPLGRGAVLPALAEQIERIRSLKPRSPVTPKP